MERELNLFPPPEGAGLSLRRLAGAHGEPVSGRRAALGTGACRRAGDRDERQLRAALRGVPGALWVKPSGTETHVAGCDREKECFTKYKVLTITIK